MLIGTCHGATFVRDCKNCTFWVATRPFEGRFGKIWDGKTGSWLVIQPCWRDGAEEEEYNNLCWFTRKCSENNGINILPVDGGKGGMRKHDLLGVAKLGRVTPVLEAVANSELHRREPKCSEWGNEEGLKVLKMGNSQIHRGFPPLYGLSN